jgi:hypothetical protein
VSEPIASPVYSLGPWSANVVDEHGVEWIVEDEQGWSSTPPVRPTSEEKTASDGAWSGPGFYGARVINLSGRAKAPDRFSMLAAKDRIKASINPRNTATLTVAEEHLTRYATVRLSDQIDLADQTAHIFSFSLTITASDPRRYGIESMTGAASLPVGLADGRTYAKTYDFAYGIVAPTYVGSVWLDNAGDYDLTPAMITFTGPVLDPRVEHVQSGRFLQFALTVQWGETLVVNLLQQTVMLNGSTNRAYTITAGSTWFFLGPGVNELLYRGTVGSAPPGETADPQMIVNASPAWT